MLIKIASKIQKFYIFFQNNVSLLLNLRRGKKGSPPLLGLGMQYFD